MSGAVESAREAMLASRYALDEASHAALESTISEVESRLNRIVYKLGGPQK